MLDFDLNTRRKRPKGPYQNRPRDSRKSGSKRSANKLLARAAEQQKRKELARIKEERKEKLSKALEEKETNGVYVKQILNPYPINHGNSNKAILPASFLQGLLQFSDIATLSPISIEISVYNNTFSSKIFAGVEEFTAEEGTIGLPPKTALTLVKESGFNVLDRIELSVRYVRLPNYGALNISIRPYGKGFFTEEETVVDIDIKSILEATLNNHIVVGLHDWIPIFWKERYFILKAEEVGPALESIDVKEVIELDDLSVSEDIDDVEREELLIVYEPKAFVILNNEVHIDILPSDRDQTRLDQRANEESLFAKAKYRFNSIKEAAEPILQKSANPKGNIKLKVNFPIGSKKLVLSLRCCVRNLFDWILFHIASADLNLERYDLNELVSAEYPFNLISPRGSNADIAELNVGNLSVTLEDLKLAKNLLLLVNLPRKVEKNSEERLFLGDPIADAAEGNPWVLSFLATRTNDQRDGLPRSELALKPAEASEEDMNQVYEELTNGFGVGHVEARLVSSKYVGTVLQLKEMGLGDRLGEAVPFILKYQGRLNRVSNALFGNS